jgi:hypothetical protein
MIEAVIGFLLGSFTLTLFLLGLAVSAFSLRGHPRPLAKPVLVEALFKWFLFFSIGISYLYNGLFHIFAHELAARLIGWPDSPFQLEVGFASLGFGLVGLLATWRSFDLRLAAILGPSLFLWGAAGVHIHSMVTEHNFAPGNAGVIFWSDILLPPIGFAFLWLQSRYEREGRSVAPKPGVAISGRT